MKRCRGLCYFDYDLPECARFGRNFLDGSDWRIGAITLALFGSMLALVPFGGQVLRGELAIDWQYCAMAVKFFLLPMCHLWCENFYISPVCGMVIFEGA